MNLGPAKKNKIEKNDITPGKTQKRLAITNPRWLMKAVIILLCSVALIALCAVGGYYLTKNALASGRLPSGEELMTGDEVQTGEPGATTEPEETTTEEPAATTAAPEAAEVFLQTVGDTFFADLQTEVDFMRLGKWADGGFDAVEDLKPRSILNAYIASGELRARLEEGETVRLTLADLTAFSQERFGLAVDGEALVQAVNNQNALSLEGETLIMTQKAISWPDEDWVLEKNAYATAGDLLVVSLTRRYESGTRTALTVTLSTGTEGYRYVSVVDESDLLAGAGSYESGSSGETGMSKVDDRRVEYYTYFKTHENQVRALFAYPENANGLAVFALLNVGQDISGGVTPESLNTVLQKYFNTGLSDWDTDYSRVENGLVYGENLNFTATNRLLLTKYSEKGGVTTATFDIYRFDGAVPAEADAALAAGNTDGYKKAGMVTMALTSVPDSGEAGGSYYVFGSISPSGVTVVPKPEVKEPTVTLDTGNLTVGSVALGMDYESASALLGDPDEAPSITDGKMVFKKNGVEYTFCQIDDSYSAAYDSLKDGRFYLLKIVTAGTESNFVLGLKVGDSLKDTLSALGCPDAKLQKWAEQTLYDRKSGSAFLYFTTKTASYHIVVNVGDTHLRIEFDANDVLTGMELELAP